MTTREKLKLLNIMCIDSEKKEFDTFYDFKFKDELHNECPFNTHLRIYTEEDLNILEFGKFLKSLNKLNTIEKGFKFLPYIDGELIFTTHQ